MSFRQYLSQIILILSIILIATFSCDCDNGAVPEDDDDIIDDGELIPIGYLTTGGDAHDIDVEGDIAYLAAYEAGLFTIDVSDPSNPVELGNYKSDDGWAFRVDAQGDFIYMSDFHSFRILEASDPANPTSIYDYHPDDEDHPWHQFFMEVLVHDTLVFISRHYFNVYNKPEWVNIANPYEPTHFNSVIGQIVNAAHIDNNRFYAVGFPIGHYVHERSVFQVQELLHANGASSNLTNIHMMDVHACGDRAYVAANDDGLMVFDVTHISAPILLASYLQNETALNVQVRDAFAFVACGWNGLKVVDVSNPSEMILIAEYRSTDYVRELHLDGDYLYVADGYNGLAVFDISGLW